MQRILVAGISGAGKSTLARALAARLDLPYVEMDALFHGPGWTQLPGFVEDVTAFTAQDRWVTDSIGYPAVRDLVWSRADTLVWLDLPRPQVMVRVLRRSLWRGLLHREIWNGNRESVLAWRRPDHPVRWAWTQYRPRRELVLERLADPQRSGLRVVHLRSAAEARRWLGGVARTGGLEPPRRRVRGR
ncbi:MAG: adenylate kinase [Actinomycetota bacterium]|nr:adenylate kinase [Actinomycetota bacterium]